MLLVFVDLAKPFFQHRIPAFSDGIESGPNLCVWLNSQPDEFSSVTHPVMLAADAGQATRG